MYQRIIQEVIEVSLIDFEEAGVSAATLEELKLVSCEKDVLRFRFFFLSLSIVLCWEALETTPFQLFGQTGSLLLYCWR